MEETKGGGPFPQLLDSELVLNAILLDANNPPAAFLTKEMVEQKKDRKLRVLIDGKHILFRICAQKKIRDF